MAYTLNTAAATDRLTAAGLDANAARAIVAEMARSDEGIATKVDLAALRSDIEAAMLRSEHRLILSGLAGLGLLFAALRLT